MNKGTFIVIEGGDGAGKDTQIDLLKEVLNPQQFLFVKDPGSTEIGLALREIVLRDDRVAKTTELLVYLAARAQLVEEKIKPALAEGRHVISNRFDLSTICYQVYGRERLSMLELVRNMSEFARGGISPDLLIFLDCPPEEGLARVLKKDEAPDRFETEKLAFHERVYQAYKKHVHNYNHVSIDATRPPEVVHADVRAAIDAVVGTVQ